MTEEIFECHFCEKEIDKPIWMELNGHTREYTLDKLDEDESQGSFPFCPRCCNNQGKTLYDVFDAMIDSARSEYHLSDIEQGYKSVLDYAENGMGIILSYDEAKKIFYHFAKYYFFHEYDLLEGQNHFNNEFHEPLDIYIL